MFRLSAYAVGDFIHTLFLNNVSEESNLFVLVDFVYMRFGSKTRQLNS